MPDSVCVMVPAPTAKRRRSRISELSTAKQVFNSQGEVVRMSVGVPLLIVKSAGTSLSSTLAKTTFQTKALVLP